MQISSTNLVPRLQEAWASRWNQRVEHAMGSLADIQSEAGWNELVPEFLSTLTRENRPVYVEALLLKASLLRAQGQRRKASALLQKIVAKVDALFEPRGFRLLFELGLDHWIDLDVAAALEFFLLAEKRARNPEERLFSVSNILLCLEALDLGREEIETRIRKLLAELVESTQISHAKEQWQAYLLRQGFFTKLAVPHVLGDLQGQSAFFVQWARALPYMNGKDFSPLSQDYIWQGGYRVRTLAGIWVPSDRESVRTSDAIDRLYLWTWFWMAKRAEISQEKLFYTLESVLQDLDLDLQSKENLLLLRNSLEWILLLEPSLASRLQKTVATLRRVQSERYPALEAEFYLIQRLSPQADSGDLEQGIKRFPIFYKILREIKDGSVKSLLPLVQERLTPFLKLSAPANYSLVVDRMRQEIRVPAQVKVLRSPAMVKLFSALEKNARIDSAALGKYLDPSQIQNLVSRARKLTSTKALLVRGQEILRGSEWPQILFLHDSQCPEVNFLPARGAKLKFVDSDAHLQAAKALLLMHFDRRTLEKKLRVSKATACRMIEAWLAEEKISKIGKAKATSYSWKNKEMNV
jgi:hypothetical protein